MARRPHSTLRDLAEACGHSPASLATAVEVDETTIYRHWVEDDWPNRMRSDVVRKLMAVVPGVDVEYSRFVVDERLDQLLAEASRADLRVNQSVLTQLLDARNIVPQFLCSALDAAISIVRQDQDRSVRSLRSCWGREQTRALDAVYGTAGDLELLADTEPLLAASRVMYGKLQRSRITYQRAIALGHLAHHLGKSSDEEKDLLSPDRRRTGLHDEMAGFFLRGGYMGILRRRDDLDLAERYGRLVFNDGAARLVEVWAFPSWTGDLTPRDDFSVPRGLTLKNTAQEVIREIETYNDAYVCYLTTIFVPLALDHVDDTFGRRIGALADAVTRRADRSSVPEVRAACLNLLRRLRSMQGDDGDEPRRPGGRPGAGG